MLNNLKIPKKMVSVWLWMLDESKDERLEGQAEKLLLTLFTSIDEARKYSA